jgi:hypothetical protein
MKSFTKILLICLVMTAYCTVTAVDVYGVVKDDPAKEYRDSAKGDNGSKK